MGPIKGIIDVAVGVLVIFGLSSAVAVSQVRSDRDRDAATLRVTGQVAKIDYWVDTDGFTVLKMALALKFQNSDRFPIAIYRPGIYVGPNGISRSKESLASNTFEAKGLRFSKLLDPPSTEDVIEKDFLVLGPDQSYRFEREVQFVLVDKDNDKGPNHARLEKGKHFVSVYVMSWPWTGQASSSVERIFGGRWRLFRKSIEVDPIAFVN